jgi:hypothetical protein
LETRKQRLGDAKAALDARTLETQKAVEGVAAADAAHQVELVRILTLFRQTEEKRFSDCMVTVHNLANALRTRNTGTPTKKKKTRFLCFFVVIF